ncbi:hypothetical protein [Butyricimonas synergistica]|uniref:hypothetical protein n=1 Tax=Butyricimonas synergistica TaxID=544644 RepID=UPI0022E8654E|nr:hypothetical protein [Butyricimonas synergistica]
MGENAENITEITPRLLKMTTKRGFIELFNEELLKEMRKGKRGKTQMEIYENLEDEYKRAFKRPRYASFDSFRRRKNN